MKKHIPELLIVIVLGLLIFQLNQTQQSSSKNIRVQPLLIKSF